MENTGAKVYYPVYPERVFDPESVTLKVQEYL
jgi:hypothetical protein